MDNLLKIVSANNDLVILEYIETDDLLQIASNPWYNKNIRYVSVYRVKQGHTLCFRFTYRDGHTFTISDNTIMADNLEHTLSVLRKYIKSNLKNWRN